MGGKGREIIDRRGRKTEKRMKRMNDDDQQTTTKRGEGGCEDRATVRIVGGGV